MVLDSLEGDGISAVLLHWLHVKDELGYGPTICLPDTVVYKLGQPVHWYFTSKIDNKIKKKSKQKLVNVQIEETFNRCGAGCDIVAYYISEVAQEHGCVSATNIEYFNRRELHEFLYTRWKDNDGLLQRFVEPKGSSNAVIRAIWSPKVCLLERRVNIKQLNDQRYGVYERAVTYEGPEYFSTAVPLRGSILPSQIQRICENLVMHISEVSFQKYRVGRMVANFKVDSKDRVWFLWSSSIRLTRENINMNPVCFSTRQPLVNPIALDKACSIDSIIQLPPHIKLADKATRSDKHAEIRASSKCVSCTNHGTLDKFHPIQYRIVIRHFERIKSLLKSDQGGGITRPPNPIIITAAGGVGFGTKFDHDRSKSGKSSIDPQIPPVIQKLHPKLTRTLYNQYRQDPLFLYKTVAVCEACFLVYAELTTSPGSSTLTKISSKSNLPAEQPTFLSSFRLEQAGGCRPTKKKYSKQIDDFPPSLPAPIYHTSAAGGGLGVCGPTRNTSPELSIGELIENREEAFFREVKASTALEVGHPLTHLVTSYRSMQFPTELARGGKGRIHGTKKSPYCEQLGLKGNGTHTEADTNTQEKKGHKTISSMDHRSFLMDTWRLASIYCKNPCDVNVGCMMYSTILRLQVRSKYGQQMHINSRAGA